MNGIDTSLAYSVEDDMTGRNVLKYMLKPITCLPRRFTTKAFYSEILYQENSDNFAYFTFPLPFLKSLSVYG